MHTQKYSSATKSISTKLLVLLGPPGAGKGTLADQIAAEYTIPQISTGELLRLHVRRKTVLGTRARRRADRGLLVGDDLVCDMVVRRITEPDCARGAILDGFPRTIGQAKWLDRYVDKYCREQVSFIVLKLNVEAEELFRRLSARRLCSSCGRAYNILLRPPNTADACDFDGAKLITRRDDVQDLIYKRIRIYQQETLPVAEYYRDKGQLREINGNRPVSSVVAEAIRILQDASFQHRQQQCR